MKNYLYILCTFLLAFAGCTKDADVEPIAPAPDENAQVVLTGFSGRGTRTGFGGAEDGAVPFLWSAGDYIWARNTRSEAIAEGGSQATFVFESLETADTYDVFYNLTGPAAATALIPAEQTQQAAGELNLGQNGDFGYATAQNGTFTLEHATSYVWFDTYSSDVTSNLLSITLSVSGGQTIAGEAAFADGKLGDCKGSSSVTLSFGEEGVALPSQSNDTDVFAAMVLYPADLSTATVSIVYKFADGSVYLQTKSGKTLTPGHTLRLSTQIAKSDRTQIRRSDPHRIARPHDHSAAIHLERHQPQVQLDDRRTRGRDRAFVHLYPDRNGNQKDRFHRNGYHRRTRNDPLEVHHAHQ